MSKFRWVCSTYQCCRATWRRELVEPAGDCGGAAAVVVVVVVVVVIVVVVGGGGGGGVVVVVVVAVAVAVVAVAVAVVVVVVTVAVAVAVVLVVVVAVVVSWVVHVASVEGDSFSATLFALLRAMVRVDFFFLAFSDQRGSLTKVLPNTSFDIYSVFSLYTSAMGLLNVNGAMCFCCRRWCLGGILV